MIPFLDESHFLVYDTKIRKGIYLMLVEKRKRDFLLQGAGYGDFGIGKQRQ